MLCQDAQHKTPSVRVLVHNDSGDVPYQQCVPHGNPGFIRTIERCSEGSALRLPPKGHWPFGGGVGAAPPQCPPTAPVNSGLSQEHNAYKGL